MSIETLLQNLITAVEANTAALLGAGASAPAEKAASTKAASTKSEKATPTKTEKAKPAHTVEEAQAALLKIKDDFSIDKAKEVLAQFGIAKMAEIKPDQADAVFAAAEKKHAELSEGGDGDEGSDGL